MSCRRVTRSLGAMLCIALVLPVCSEEAASVAEKLRWPLAYSGYTVPEYKGMSVRSEYAPMSDGTKLAVDIYLPAEGPERASFPVILEYLPYQRATINPETGVVRDSSNDYETKLFVSHGYAFVRADMRGTGASTGWLFDFMPKLCDDGKELVDWIAAQRWCDGNAGMKGCSYLGWSQTATASRKPKALKCIAPTVIPLDGYTGEVYPGGIYLEGFIKDFSHYMEMILRNKFLPSMGVLPTKPVVDEDGDGELADEIPVDANGNGTFLDDGFPPAYRDGQARKHVYYLATVDHDKGDYDYHQWASVRPFIDSELPIGGSLYDLSPSAHVPDIMESGIAVYNIGGWFDGFTRGTFELYCTMAKTNPSKLLMFPSYHEPAEGPFWAYFGEDQEKAEKGFFVEHLRFFDHYLKGIDNDIGREPPICIYVMHGGGWRCEKEWPLARQVMARHFMDAGNALARQRTGSGKDEYRVDLSHSSTYTENHGNRWLGIGGQWPKTPPTRTDKDKQCLVYTSEPVSDNTEVTGHPVIHLWVSSTANDGDFFIYLEDVDERGEAWLVSEGQLRAGFARLHDNNEMVCGGRFGIDVKPELPWHGYKKAGYDERVFADGAVVELVIDFFPTSWVFRKGHRIRVSIACADYPTFPLHPRLSPKNNPLDPENVVPTISLHRNDDHASCVDLPVIPPT